MGFLETKANIGLGPVQTLGQRCGPDSRVAQEVGS
ncbi:hypothetical protein COLO4_28863 [Corchorus olitorius]|uniref:Uncharacterized protein n=1 Tax=Corchorus olitorius TaxID=93759 RepID=A0A1R3HI08_9ROSI|nr:hypothetical protein COLO4_28863 [Corchorus olitorius]